MKFRCPGDKPIHIASTTGHADWVGLEFKELHPLLHVKALQLGCITDNMSQASIDANKPVESHRIEGYEERLNQVLLQLKETGEDLTSNGMPDLRKLGKRLGFGVDRDDVMNMWVKINKENPVDNREAA